MMCACTFGLSSCGDDYDDSELRNDIGNLEDRVTALEEWQKSVNTDIRSLQSIVAALEDKDYVTAVTPLEDGTGYVISFLKSGNVTIRHGEKGERGDKGDTPVISVKQDTDGKYYWTVNGAWLLDNGNKIPVTGEKGDKGDKGDNGNDGQTPHVGDNGNWWIGTTDTGVKAQGDAGADGLTPYIGDNGNWWIGTTDTGVKAQGDKGADATAPQLRINTDTNEWEISTDNGINWTSTGVKATGEKGDTGAQGEKGDSMFSAIDNSNENYVELTLADGTTKIRLLKYAAFSIAFESDEVFYASPTDNELKLVLPATLKESDYRSIIATVTATNGADVQTRSMDGRWSVTVTKPVFGADGVLVEGSAKVAIKGTENTRLSDTYLLRVALVATNGTEVVASRLVKYFDGEIVERYSDIKDLTAKRLAWKGNMSDDDFEYIRNNMASTLEVLDLSATTLTELPMRALAFYSSMGLSDNTTLKEVLLPEGLKTIGTSAFAMCKALNKLNIPSTVTTLGRWILEGSSLSSFTIPNGVTEIPASCFYGSAITSIEIPSSVNTIGDYAFEDAKLIKVVIPSSVTSIGYAAFGCWDDNPTLKSVVIEANITEIPECCFYLQSNLTSVSLPEGVTSIGDDAFCWCKKLASLTLPASLEVIGEGAFSTNALTELVLPNKVSTIKNSAFAGNNIAVIDLPASIKSLHSAAFHWESTALKTVICRATTVPDMPSSSAYPPFIRMKKDNVELKVPAGSLTDYQQEWGTYFKSVEAM